MKQENTHRSQQVLTRETEVRKWKKKRHKIEKAQHITCFSTVDVWDLLRSIGEENVEKYIPM